MGKPPVNDPWIAAKAARDRRYAARRADAVDRFKAGASVPEISEAIKLSPHAIRWALTEAGLWESGNNFGGVPTRHYDD